MDSEIEVNMWIRLGSSGEKVRKPNIRRRGDELGRIIIYTGPDTKHDILSAVDRTAQALMDEVGRL